MLRLRRQARKGNKRSMNALIKRNKKMAARANRMLDRLEKHGYTKQAYMSAQNFIQAAYGSRSNRYATNLTDPNAIYQQGIAIEHFLSLKTSTLRGTHRVEDLRVAGFRAQFPKATKGMSKRQILNFFDFLSEESIDAYLSEAGQYESGDEVDSFLYAVNEEERQLSEIVKAVEKYREDFINPPQDGSERFYHDDLVKYLKGGIDIMWDDNNQFHIVARGERAKPKRRSRRK